MEPTDRPQPATGPWWTALAVIVAVLAVASMVGVDSRTTALVLAALSLGLIVAVLVWAEVTMRHRRRAHEEALVAWAAERATRDERLRIARELHDLASHGLGLITVRAAAARAVSGPSEAGEQASALADIEAAARGATTELRRMLALLRDPQAEPAPLTPAVTLGEVPTVVERARAAGLRVTFEDETGGTADLSGGVQAAACAVVQEGLANVGRHAGPTTARVRLQRVAHGLAVVVEDDGPVPDWTPSPGAGAGLRGLGERVSALGGELHAGAQGAGFRLEARLRDEEAG